MLETIRDAAKHMFGLDVRDRLENLERNVEQVGLSRSRVNDADYIDTWEAMREGIDRGN